MLEIWGMRSTPSLPLLQGPLWSGVVAPDKILSIGQIEEFDIQTVLTLNWIVWNRTVLHLIVCKQKNYTHAKLNSLR